LLNYIMPSYVFAQNYAKDTEFLVLFNN